MKYSLKGKGKVTLDKDSFIAKGGQGAIYADGDLAYKIYFNPDEMIPMAKIGELRSLEHGSIINPLDLLMDGKNRPIGYSMQFVRDSFPLCRLFTKSFKRKHQVEREQLIKLVEDFYKTVSYVHSRNILIVDLNEMNFLVNTSFDKVLFIDVDSYQTAGFPAQVIMESIRDRHTRGFNRNSDWFSWAIVTFQMLIGIHPYKGKHKGGLKMDERMEQNISVFNSAVSVPALCEPFSTIPAELRAWYRALFEDGKRLPPPDAYSRVVRPAASAGERGAQITTQAEGRKVCLALLKEFAAEPLNYAEYFGLELLELPGSLQVGGKEIHSNLKEQVTAVTPRDNTPLAVGIEDGFALIRDLKRDVEIDCSIEAESLMSYKGAVYLKCREQVFELDFIESASSIKAVPRVAANVVPGAARLFRGLLVQNLVKSCYVTLFPERGKSYQLKLDFLSGSQVVDAAYENGVMVVIAFQKGSYSRFILRFNADFSDFDVRVEQNISNLEINFTALPNGVVLSVNDNDELELFFSKMGSQDNRLIRDDSTSGGRLFHRGTEVLMLKGQKLYKISLER